MERSNQKKAKSDKSFYLFAVNLDEDRYACILFNANDFNEFLSMKIKTSDERYFFYFAKKKY
ncbi:TPA: hypothetical protein ACGO06_000576 [Streptococcus suis]